MRRGRCGFFDEGVLECDGRLLFGGWQGGVVLLLDGIRAWVGFLKSV